MSLVPPDPAADAVKDTQPLVCGPEHCFYAFDALFCELTQNTLIPPKFPDDK